MRDRGSVSAPNPNSQTVSRGLARGSPYLSACKKHLRDDTETETRRRDVQEWRGHAAGLDLEERRFVKE
jgi:hypothetical protein